MRRDPRYYEPRVVPDPENWAVVRFAQRFGEMREFQGKLYDLTPRAVRVVVEKKHLDLLQHSVGAGAYVTFKIRDELQTTLQTAIIARTDEMEEYAGVVLFFEMMNEPDKAALEKLCQEFQDRYGHPAEASADGQGPK